MGGPNHGLGWWSVFSSLPQPIGAVLAFSFVRIAREVLAFGFAAGAMAYLALSEFTPEALEQGENVPGGGRTEPGIGLVVGATVTLPLAFV